MLCKVSVELKRDKNNFGLKLVNGIPLAIANKFVWLKSSIKLWFDIK